MSSRQDEQALLDGMVKDMARAKELGLVPDSGSKVSRRGEFQVNPSNIEDDENKKMRGYRVKEFPLMTRRWGTNPHTGQPGVESLAANDKAHLEQLLADGWTTDLIDGPPAAVEADDAGLDVVVPAPRRRKAALTN